MHNSQRKSTTRLIKFCSKLTANNASIPNKGAREQEGIKQFCKINTQSLKIDKAINNNFSVSYIISQNGNKWRFVHRKCIPQEWQSMHPVKYPVPPSSRPPPQSY